MIYYIFLSSVAGLSISRPSSVKREPWQGQSQVCSARLYLRAQPRCGHRGAVGVRRPTVDSKALIASCGRKTVREGSKRLAYGLDFPRTRSQRRSAETIAVVIPHLLNPVATNMLGVDLAYCPI